MSDTVLAIIELENHPEQVANRAAWIAGLFDCSVHLMLCDPSLAILRDSFIVSNEAKEIAAGIESAQREVLSNLETAIGTLGGREVVSSISHDRPEHDAIIAMTHELEPRFVVKGTRHHSTAERATFAYTDWQLIRKLPAPLWFVKPNDWDDEPVLVGAVDPTHQHDTEGKLDQVIVETGKDIAGRCSGRLVLLHTYQRLVEIGSYAKLSFKPIKLPIEELDRKTREEHRQKLDALASRNGIAADAVHQLPGRTRDLLPTFARTQGADLVIMGALARSGLRRRTLGSTAEQVLDYLPCDILIARAPG